MSPPELRVLETCQVSPPPGAVAESTLPLTYLDLIWLKAGTVERLFFYPFAGVSTSHFVDSIVPSLKASLAVTLRSFYPLAGKISRSPTREDGFDIHYADGDSVSFTVAEHDGDFHELSGGGPRLVNMLVPLLPELPRDGGDGFRLLALQATVFPDRGVAVGVSVHHAACDGSSSMRFMAAWAAAAASAGAAQVAPPVLERSFISDPDDLYTFFYKGISTDQTIETMLHQTTSPDAVLESFTIGKKHIDKLKELATGGAAGASFHCSTVVVAYAYAWVCHVKTRRPKNDKDKHAFMGFVADCRGRLKPPVPAAYFGNCLSGCLVESEIGDLTGKDGVATAAREIGKAIEAFKEGPFKAFTEELPKRYQALVAEQPLSVAGSPKFKVYDVDFGWGRPSKVEITSIAKTSAMAVAESREEEGGVEIGLVKPQAEMEAFEKEFYGGLQLLQ
ncbi:phenolic glucoside malonyltransferase 1-like [Zingiber officinale]|uniref:Uncharacterized protein n=1 Tax=Zingiber officinale TaxID=94328 RepID=A0A8J5F2P3_ZINOF|nr:phenolic glucoside malonyltransferase 1-like [Zingiber officinale]KAG6476558.1 hypothetical protein ZIOFF_065800 [Zingiber officinale]